MRQADDKAFIDPQPLPRESDKLSISVISEPLYALSGEK